MSSRRSPLPNPLAVVILLGVSLAIYAALIYGAFRVTGVCR